MLIALTGTPGTGKSTVSDELTNRGHQVIRANDTIGPYIIEEDDERQAHVIDTDRWRDEFPLLDGIVEGHLTHLLPVSRVIVIRCRPDVLKERLVARGYPDEKVAENVEAELLDVVLIEAMEEHTPEMIYEMDVTDKTVAEVADMIEGILTGDVPPKHGVVDWLSTCVDLL
ncbi:adenylate kinase family protein [Methanospirillum lacunae]|uniref:Putative adenylate kinase n=1 Tax=Methanospirillum lacunae TaxID=668570 RepID=A0A2V2N4U9_9EURY|nr:adenylate kinase family protein [Methanospirillum lacunae]PWR70531.1 adenylate kinase [Methanospirillum lacunae]